jgi:diguanylate cyclase (GGDEF)-like protein/PAS domain S-box-containing protein
LIRLLDRLGGARSLQLRFMLMVVLGAAVFSLVGGGAAFFYGQQRALENSTRSIEGLVAAVEKSLAIGAYAKDGVLLGELVEGLLRNELVQDVEVRAPDGSVLARAGRAARAEVGGDTAIERPLFSPFDAAETVATLQLRADREVIARRAAREAAIFGGFMVLQGAALALLLYATAAWLVSGPIVRLARAMPAMAPGTDDRLPKPSAHRHDEIGLLVDAANQLLDAHGIALRRERELRAEIEAMEAQYRQIFDSSSAGIFVLDAHYRLINSNPTVSRVVGMSPERLKELRHDNFIERVFDDPHKVLRMLQEAADGGETVSGDLALLRGEGRSPRWVHCLISVQDGGAAPAAPPVTIEGVIYDVTERRRAERRTRHRAEHDPLTGLKNRGATEVLLDRMIAEALRAGSCTTLLCLDLDGFKRVNDELGHQAGDQVLVACAQAMRTAVRGGIDLVGRVGGDEFFIALQHAGPGDAVVDRTALALVEALRRPIVLDDGREAQIGVSIGIACMPLHAGDRAGLVALADEALYEVKRSGKNTYAMAAASLRRPGEAHTAAAAEALPLPSDTAFQFSDF